MHSKMSRRRSVSERLTRAPPLRGRSWRRAGLARPGGRLRPCRPAAQPTRLARSAPRATDPKIRTFFAPCRRAARRMRARFWRNFTILGVRTSRRRGEPSATSSSRSPMTASSRSRVSTDDDDAPDSYREAAGWDVPARAASAPLAQTHALPRRSDQRRRILSPPEAVPSGALNTTLASGPASTTLEIS